jgi:hypothetical protein
LVLDRSDSILFSPVEIFVGWGSFFKNNIVFDLALVVLVSQDFFDLSGSPVREFVDGKEIGSVILLVVGIDNRLGLEELLVSECEFFFGPVVLSMPGNVPSKFAIICSEEAS